MHRQKPEGVPAGELILIHGLEGSSESGYARSMAAAALEAGFVVNRYNMRGCGNSPWHPRGNYHSGQTGDVLLIARERKQSTRLPLFLVGFSLGGNVTLKLAGELRREASELFAGVCAVSTPIDLSACVDQTARRENHLYQQRFVSRLKERVRKRHALAPELFTLEHLPKIRTIRDFDDYYTAPLFGFGTAANYYRTQSSNQFLDAIQIPALIVQAKDDPMIPFAVYDHPAFRRNPNLELIAVEHGGHLGFISRVKPRFWLDGLVMDWVRRIALQPAAPQEISKNRVSART